MYKAIVVLFLIAAVAGELPTIWIGPPTENEPRIIKGEDAKDGEFPYMASLRRKGSPGHSCGASVLTKNWALTAAHCCPSKDNMSKMFLYVGSIYLSRGGTYHAIEKVVPHEDYQPSNKWRNDICVIRVSQPFVFSDKVKQVVLAPQDWPVKSGDKVTISGWGYTTPNMTGLPDRLQKGVDFVAMSPDECQRITGLQMFPGYLCARGRLSGQSTWNGDSGGPLVKDGAEVGLTSFGFRPYGNNMPTVYCRVTNYVNWIKEKLGAEASQLKFK